MTSRNASGKMEGGLRTRGIKKKSAPRSPLISIIQPVFNASHCLEASIKSVLGQTYKNIEYIVVDGGSDDGTIKVIQKYEERIDYWVSEKDESTYDAMNKGADLASGDWVQFLGADDVLVNNTHNVARLLEKPHCIYYGDVYWPSQNRVYDSEFTWHKLIQKNICHQAIFYPRRVFQLYKYDLKYSYCADYALNIRLWVDRRFKFRYMPLLVAVYNDSGVGKSHPGYDGQLVFAGDPAFEKDREALIQIAFSRKIRLRNAYLNAQSGLVKMLETIGLKKLIAGALRR